MNKQHAAKRPGRDDLAARVESYELAFRMQAEVPELLDISKEDEKTQQLYGIGTEPTDGFGRRCLLHPPAPRLLGRRDRARPERDQRGGTGEAQRHDHVAFQSREHELAMRRGD